MGTLWVLISWEKKEMKFVSRAGASLPGYKMKFLADAGRGDGTCFPTLIRDDSSTVYGALYGLEEGVSTSLTR